MWITCTCILDLFPTKSLIRTITTRVSVMTLVMSQGPQRTNATRTIHRDNPLDNHNINFLHPTWKQRIFWIKWSSLWTELKTWGDFFSIKCESSSPNHPNHWLVITKQLPMSWLVWRKYLEFYSLLHLVLLTCPQQMNHGRSRKLSRQPLPSILFIQDPRLPKWLWNVSFNWWTNIPAHPPASPLPS